MAGLYGRYATIKHEVEGTPRSSLRHQEELQWKKDFKDESYWTEEETRRQEAEYEYYLKNVEFCKSFGLTPPPPPSDELVNINWKETPFESETIPEHIEETEGVVFINAEGEKFAGNNVKGEQS